MLCDMLRFCRFCMVLKSSVVFWLLEVASCHGSFTLDAAVRCGIAH